MTASVMKREIQRLAIDDVSEGEAGIMRVILFQSLGLGLPKPKNWTTKSIRYILDNVTNTPYDPDQIKLKENAVDFLKTVLAKKTTKPPPDPNNGYRRLARQLRLRGEDQYAATCDHHIKFGEMMEPELLETLEIAAARTVELPSPGSQNDGRDRQTGRQLFDDDTDSNMQDNNLEIQDLTRSSSLNGHESDTTVADLIARQHQLRDQLIDMEKLLGRKDNAKKREVDEVRYANDYGWTKAKRAKPDTRAEPMTGGPMSRHTFKTARDFLKQNFNLSNQSDGWKTVLNVDMIPEIVPESHPIAELRGLEFYTAAAIMVSKQERIRQRDHSGLRDLAIIPGYQRMALEWLDSLYREGYSLLGDSPNFNQLRFSVAAQQSLAGAGHTPPDPVSLATFFTQLYQAGTQLAAPLWGTDNRKLQPHPLDPHGWNNQANGSNGHHNGTRTRTGWEGKSYLSVPIDEEVLQGILTTASNAAPIELDRRILDRAVRAVASKPGETFRDKQIWGLKALSYNMRAPRAVDNTVWGQSESYIPSETTTQARKAAVSLCVEALASARATKGNVNYLNTSTEPVQKCILATILRSFASKEFQLHHLVPKIPGVPEEAKLKEAFGEAQECRMDASSTAGSNEADDRLYYPWLRYAIDTLTIIDVPSMDFGFVTSMKFFSENVSTFESNGTPLSLVTRAICKVMISAQRQREQALNYDKSDDLVLTYVEPDWVTDAKSKLLQWSRESQADEMVKFRRYMEAAGFSPSAGSNSQRMGERNKGPTQQTSSVTFASVEKSRPKKLSLTSENKTGSGPMSQLNDMDKDKWVKDYGNVTVNGRKVKICWWHANRKGGCAKESSCPNNHSHYPTQYGGLPFARLKIDEQKSIMSACKRL